MYDGLPSAGSFSAQPLRISLPNQPLGEAVAWAPDGRALLLASESDDRLLRLPLPQQAWTAAAQAAVPTPTAAGPADPALPSAGGAASGAGQAGGGWVRAALAVLLGLGAVGAVLLGNRLRR